MSIGKKSGSFADDNWDNLEAFAAEFSPDRNAVIVIQRTEEDGSQTMMGMFCRDGEWMQTPANLLLGINPISPDLKKRPATPNLRCADITCIYPDCPATVLTGEGAPQEDKDEEEEGDHNPAFDAIPKGAVTHSPSTEAQIKEQCKIAGEIDDMFQWISTLDAEKDNLYCGIYTVGTDRAYPPDIWNYIADADCNATTAKVVIVKEDALPNGSKKSIIMGIKHDGDKWGNLTQAEIRYLVKAQPEAFDWVANVQNPTYANIKDIYPSCPM